MLCPYSPCLKRGEPMNARIKFQKGMAIGIVGLVAILIGVAPLQAAGGTQVRVTQVDASQFPKITVYISVTDASGEPMSIDPNRITISENGVRMKIDQVRAISGTRGKSEGERLTTLLVIDVSGSMNEAGKLDAAKKAAGAYVDQMRTGDQAGLLTFSTQITLVQPVTADHNALKAAIDKLQAADYTAMYDALGKGVENLQSVPGRKTIIVMTDGLDNRSKSNVDDVVKQIGPSGLSISAVGLGEPSQGTASMAGIDESALKSLAQRTGGLYSYVKDADALTKLFQYYGRVLQNEYAITYTSPSQQRDGVTRNLSVALADAAGSSVSTQARYNPGGVVPEIATPVAAVGWPLFGIALVALLALLILPGVIARVPGVISRGGEALRGLQPTGGRARFTNPEASKGGAAPNVFQRAGARVRDFFGRSKPEEETKKETKKGTRIRISDQPKPREPRVRFR